MITLRNMRENGVPSLAITCGAVWCYHQAVLDVDAFADDVAVPVAQEGLPCLRRSISPRYHVLRDCRLGDVEAELQKLAVDVRRTPERVLEAHSSDKVAHLFVDLRSAPRGRDFHRQNALKPLRCQRTIVSGLKIIMASRMRGKPR